MMAPIRYTAEIVVVCAFALSACGAPATSAPEFQGGRYYLVGDTSVAENLPNVQAEKMKSLALERATLSDRDVAIIRTFKNLERLNLIGCDQNRSVSGNSGSAYVYVSEDNDWTIDAQEFKDAAEQQAWQMLRDHGANVFVAAGRPNSQPDLFIEAVALKGPFPKRELLLSLTHLSKLIRLYINAVPLTNYDLKIIGELKSLTVLNLAKCDVGDSSLKQIGSLDQLKILILAQNPITDDGLKNLAPLKSLEELNLSATSVRGVGLAHLRNNSRLQRLSISSTKLDDDGIKQVLQFPNLHTIDCDGTLVTKEGIMELAKLPWLSQISATDALYAERIKQFHEARRTTNERARASGMPIPDDYDSPFGKDAE